MLVKQITTFIEKRKSYALIREENGIQIRHTNANEIDFGNHDFMHLHIWNKETRRKGMGVALVKKSLPIYFEKLKINTLFCQPYTLNIAPNKTLEKAGFVFVKKYKTILGSLNFEQDVNLWKINRGMVL